MHKLMQCTGITLPTILMKNRTKMRVFIAESYMYNYNMGLKTERLPQTSGGLTML